MSPQINKNRIANSFSNAAVTYDNSAQLQQDVGYELLKLIDAHGVSPDKILDLGCGTGFFSERLASLFPRANLVCLDIAHGMLKHARESRKSQQMQWLCADAEAIPLQNNSIGLLFSSLAIQWCENLSMLFKEIHRVLNKDGMAVISTLGPASLSELRESWVGVDENVHVNSFVSINDLIKQLPASLSLQVCKEQTRVVEYDKLGQLTSDLKNIGAHNMNVGESKGLTGRFKIKTFKANYEVFRQTNRKLPASYEVYYLVLRKNNS
ncbi:MAG: malonyl-CoA O-methyltransferase [Oceanospirillaceae bacterium]|jgi:malonyl-CoA O-methyltransferase